MPARKLKQASLDLLAFPEKIDTPEVREAFQDFMDYRAEEKASPVGPRGALRNLRAIAHLSPDDALYSIDLAIRKGWSGLHAHTRPLERPKDPSQKPLSTWEIKERLKACQNELEGLLYPGGCAFAVDLNQDQTARANTLRVKIKDYKTRLTS